MELPGCAGYRLGKKILCKTLDFHHMCTPKNVVFVYFGTGRHPVAIFSCIHSHDFVPCIGSGCAGGDMNWFCQSHAFVPCFISSGMRSQSCTYGGAELLVFRLL
jgi:hypothetical protein